MRLTCRRHDEDSASLWGMIVLSVQCKILLAYQNNIKPNLCEWEYWCIKNYHSDHNIYCFFVNTFIALGSDYIIVLCKCYLRPTAIFLGSWRRRAMLSTHENTAATPRTCLGWIQEVGHLYTKLKCEVFSKRTLPLEASRLASDLFQENMSFFRYTRTLTYTEKTVVL